MIHTNVLTSCVVCSPVNSETKLIKVIKVTLAASFPASVSLSLMSQSSHFGSSHASLLQYLLLLLF